MAAVTLPRDTNMDAHSILTYTLVAGIAIASPAPATVMALQNSLTYGAKSNLWSSLGNASRAVLHVRRRHHRLGCADRSSNGCSTTP